jgi:hypothetical protein
MEEGKGTEPKESWADWFKKSLRTSWGHWAFIFGFVSRGLMILFIDLNITLAIIFLYISFGLWGIWMISIIYWLGGGGKQKPEEVEKTV